MIRPGTGTSHINHHRNRQDFSRSLYHILLPYVITDTVLRITYMNIE